MHITSSTQLINQTCVSERSGSLPTALKKQHRDFSQGREVGHKKRSSIALPRGTDFICKGVPGSSNLKVFLKTGGLGVKQLTSIWQLHDSNKLNYRHLERRLWENKVKMSFHRIRLSLEDMKRGLHLVGRHSGEIYTPAQSKQLTVLGANTLVSRGRQLHGHITQRDSQKRAQGCVLSS